MLPAPDPSFEWVETAWGPALVCRPLAAVAPHLFTTRAWTLGSPAGGEDEGWSEVAAALQIDGADLVRVRQVHVAAAVVRHAGEAPPQGVPADIVATDAPHAAAAVRAADCVPILVADPRSGAVAAAHAGWRGTALGVAARTVDVLAGEYDSRPEDLVAAIGPSIGPCCYEVGDLRSCFTGAVDRWFLAEPLRLPRNPPLRGLEGSARPGRWFLDLWTATRDQLRQAGVRVDRIFAAELCTASHAVFCSYRRDGAGAGRLAAAIRTRAAERGAR